MNCEECKHGVLDHYVEGSPRAVYTCNHPYGLTYEGDCRLDNPTIIRNRPNKRLLEIVINFLEGIGLEIYGNNVDLENGSFKGGYMDYDIEDIIKLYDHIKNDTLY